MSTNTKSPPTSDDELQAALSDLSSLGRVSHRLAMLDDPSRLESVLDKLLSRLLERIGTNHQLQALANIKNNQLLTDTLTKIHQKLVETLSHVMKRVRDDRWVKLNCNSILKLLLISSDGSMPQANPSVNPFTLNLSLAFLTLGVPRCSETDLKQILADLILLHGFYAKKALGSTNVSALSHWHQISHLVVKSLEMIVEYHRQETKNLSKKPKLASASTSFATPSQLLSITAATSNTSSSTPETSGASSMDAIHNVLSKDHAAASALYDLLLDTLLYQNTTGGVPPAGCSQAGQERLQSNKSWVAEMAPPARLSLCKTRLLEWVAPTLQTSLFPENQARTCTLLLVACGDCGSVSTQAELYLKQYLDSEQERNDCTPSEIYLDLIMELLVFCVGSNNALLALSGSDLPALGIAHPQSQHTSIMPFRRRMVSDTTFSVMMSHVYKILSTVPQLFEKSQDQKSMEQVGTLSILAISKMIIKLRTSTGLTALRGKPYVSAAQALNSLVVRFLSTIERAEDQPMDKAGLARIKSLLAKALALACTSLSTTVIGHSSSATTTTISSEGNILVRHALYGIICALSRSTTLVSDPYSWLFAIGKEEDENTVKIDTATLLFSCLANEEQSLLPRATAALDAVLAAYCRITTRKKQVDAVHEEPQHSDNPWSVKNTPNSMSIDTSSESNAMLHEHLARSLLPLLWRASQYNRTKASRLASVRWTSELLKSLDLTNACHLLCFLAGDKDVTVASIARRGLGLGDNDKQNKSQHMDSENESPKLGDFSILTKLLFSNINSSGIWRPNFWEFQPTAKASSIAYLLKCLLNDFYGGDDEAIYLYMDAMTKSLVEVENLGRSYVELLDECAASLSACISTALFARRLIFGTGERCLSLDFGDMEKLAMNISSSCARRDLADACGSIYGDTSLWEKDEWLSSIVRLMETCLGLLEDSRGELGSVHGAAFLGGTCVQHFRLNPNLSIDGNGWTLAGRILSALGRGTTVSDDIVFTESLSVALSFDKGRYADAPPLNSRLQEGATSALSGLAKALRKYSSDEHTDVSRASKVAHSMGICLEATIPFSGGCKKESDELHIVRLLCVDSLLSLLGSPAYRKDEMIALEAGQALAGYAWVPKGLEWEASGSEEWPREIDEEFARSLPPHQQIVYTLLRGSKLNSNPLKRTSYAPVLLAVVARAASRVNNDPSYANTSLVQELSRNLDEFQNCFISILADTKSKHLCRESCCLGLAACWSLAKLSNCGDEVNAKLLRAFGQTTNFGTSAMQETQDQANRRRIEEGTTNDGDNAGSVAEVASFETEVGGASGMSEAALGALREMAAAAVSLGRPDILYALFMLSVTHPAWFSKDGRERYGPSALLGENSIIGSRSNAAELRLALRPHLGKILPRLLRASHDPNKQTREQIKNLWDGLTGGGAEARLAITQHLLLVIDSLIADTSHKLWRARVGATGALAQVIVGRSWNELGGGPPALDDDDILSNASNSTAGIRMLKLWNISMRSLDDVRAAVRESGETLARAVRSLTLRLCNPIATDDSQNTTIDKKTHYRDSSAAAATSLRWLIRHGLNQPCAEATGVSVSCLVGVITTVNPSILQPLIPDLLRSLLLAMSSLEPAALSYLQVRAAGQGTDAESSYASLERLRLQVAQTGPLAEAVTLLVDMVPNVALDVQRAVIPQLNSALRQSVGFTTRAAVADACSSLCHSSPNAFKFTGPTSTNPSVGLLRGFFHGAEREAGAAARNKMAHAFGNLASLCPGSSVRALALRACDNYNSATGANHDPTIRLSAAIALRSLAVRAHNQFSDGGKNDIWCKRVLPVSYLGMRDSDENVAQLWQEVWEEGGSVANLSGDVDDFGTVLEEKLLIYIVKECNKALADVSWSRRASGSAALKELADLRVLAPLPCRYEMSNAQNRESERFERRSFSSHLALSSLVKLLAATRLWSGKSEVAKATVQIAANWSSSNGEEAQMTPGSDKSSLKMAIIMFHHGLEDDLFAGDDWFQQEHDDVDDTESTSRSETNKRPPPENQLESDCTDLSDIDLDAAEAETSEEVTSTAPISFVGLCRLLFVQAFPTARASLSVSEEDVLPYRAAVFQSLTYLLNNVDSSNEGNGLKKRVYKIISEKLISVFSAPSVLEGSLKEPPLFVSRSLDCFGACFWNGISAGNDEVEILALAKVLFQCLEQPAWTVRESATLCCSSLVLKSHRTKLGHYETISLMVACVSQAVKDRKFWRVRFAGIKLLHSLISRVGHVSDSTISSNKVEQDDVTHERQKLLESMLPHKDEMLKLAKQSLSDSEAKVTALASEIAKAMAWWP